MLRRTYVHVACTDVGDQGRGLGTAVLRQFIPRVFEHNALRLQGHTHIENEPMRRLFRRFGFIQEGILHDYWPLPFGDELVEPAECAPTVRMLRKTVVLRVPSGPQYRSMEGRT